MTVDQLPGLEGNFLGGCQCKRRQPRLGGTQRGVQRVAASSQRAEARARARADGRKSGRIVARPLLVHLTTLQRPGEHSEHHPLVGRGSLRLGEVGLGGDSGPVWESGLRTQRSHRWLWGPPQSRCLHSSPWGCKGSRDKKDTTAGNLRYISSLFTRAFNEALFHNIES